MITIVYTIPQRNRTDGDNVVSPVFTDTLLHMENELTCADMDTVIAFVSGAWYAFTNTRDGARCESFDVTGTYDGGHTFVLHVCRGTHGGPDIHER